MNAILALFFQRMRLPLVVLISAYSIAVLGFTLVPGVDDAGNPWRMSLFEAFYVVSYTGSTIGFGEVPYEFTPAQRLWTTVSIYLTVVAWLFSIGTIISLLQEPASRNILEQARLQRTVRRIQEPFYLLCGYGDAGSLLASALSAAGQRVVVIESDRERIDRLAVEDLGATVPGFCMDANEPDNLLIAGLQNRWCAGVLAVTGSDASNLKVAITAKLLNRRAAVYARADRVTTASNMASFDTEHVLQPVEEFTQRLQLALSRPDTFRLQHWLTSGPRAVVPERVQLPRGRWVLCGYGPLGRSLYNTLRELAIEVTVVDERRPLAELPPGSIEGRGTEAVTLNKAAIGDASAVLALTEDDTDNLSILITARELNPNLFLAGLENHGANHALFEAAGLDFIGRPSLVVAGMMLSQLSAALIRPFLQQLQYHDEQLSSTLLARLQAACGSSPPGISTVRISARRSPAIAARLQQGESVPLGALCRDPRWRGTELPLVPLLLRRGDQDLIAPAPDTDLEFGDQILVAGPRWTRPQVRKLLYWDQALAFAVEGWLPDADPIPSAAPSPRR